MRRGYTARVTRKAANQWQTVKASYWFRPSLYVLGGIALALALLEIGHLAPLPRRSSEVWWFYTGSEQDAAQLLGTIAMSILTVAGVTFSMSVAALSMASQTYGPRVLRSFMRDAGDQTVFGIFLGTFAYAIVVQRSLHSPREVPILAVFGATVLALVSVGALIFYIHHITRSMEPESLINAVAADLDRCIDDLYPEHTGRAETRENGKAPPDIETIRDTGARLKSDRCGYVQVVEADTIMRLAVEHDVTVLILKQPGYYSVMEGSLAIVAPKERLTRSLEQQLRETFALAGERNMMQDPEYGINQTAEVIVHALSPGINNPFTAAIGIDRLSASLAKLAAREIPSPFRYDDGGRLRIIAYPVSFTHLLKAAFGPVRRSARSAEVVYKRLVTAIAEIAQHAYREEDRAELSRELNAVLAGARRNLELDADWDGVRERGEAAFEVLEAGVNPPPSVITSMKER